MIAAKAHRYRDGLKARGTKKKNGQKRWRGDHNTHTHIAAEEEEGGGV
jgi:hypothetical protein